MGTMLLYQTKAGRSNPYSSTTNCKLLFKIFCFYKVCYKEKEGQTQKDLSSNGCTPQMAALAKTVPARIQTFAN